MYHNTKDRAPTTYLYDYCIDCGFLLPSNIAEFENIYATLGIPTIYLADSYDEWFCPHCNYNYAHHWRSSEISWYDPDIALEFPSARRVYHVCCNSFSVSCNCKVKYTFDDVANGADGEFKLSQFYALSIDKGVDCSSCMLYGTQSCVPLLDDLYDLTHGYVDIADGITPCPSYVYNSANENQYALKGLTPQAVRSKFSQTLKGSNARS